METKSKEDCTRGRKAWRGMIPKEWGCKEERAARTNWEQERKD